jgi:H+/Na+-translocating ferredoxin:NAD+ oxidoreductase subunit A
MGELVLVALAAALVNNFVLVQFLGVCPFMNASQRFEGTLGVGLATGLVLTIASGLSNAVERYALAPFGLEYLRLIAFVLVVGAAIKLTELFIRRFAPLLHRVLGLYIPLVASNCAVLGVALLNSSASRSLVAALFYGAGAAAGFAVALTLFAGLRDRAAQADVPVAFRGPAIAFVTAGILSLAFMGFTGFARL